MLSEIRCRTAKATEKPIKLFDGGGLYLEVSPKGTKSWRLKYRHHGKEKKMTLGRYPLLSLKEARAERDQARAVLQSGRDPMAERKRKEAANRKAAENTFSAIAEEWWNQERRDWTPRYAKRVNERLENARRAFGHLPISTIEPMHVLEMVRTMQARDAPNMARRVLQLVNEVFAYAIATARARHNPAEAIRSAIKAPAKRRRAAPITIGKAKHALQLIEQAENGWWATLLASRLVALTAARPGLALIAERSEFQDLDGPEPIWRVPAHKMKLRLDQKQDEAFSFVIPLSRQSAETVLTAMEHSPSERYVFPGKGSWRQPLHENALSDHYREAGLRGVLVPHGWRAAFSTIMNERAAIEGRDGDRAIIDLMLAHMKDNVETAYNRAAYLPRRRELAQIWADMLLEQARAPESLISTP